MKMNNYFMYRDQIVCRIGEVAVHNMPGTPEAHLLFKGNGQYLTMTMTDADRLMKPVESLKVVQLIDNERKTTAIMQSLILTFGPIETWATRRRIRTQARARQLFFWAMRNSTSFALMEISKMIPGDYDHATVIHGCKVIDREIECDEDVIVSGARAIASTLELLGCTKLHDRINALEVRGTIAKERMRKNKEALA